jgi:hypothetical protein
MKYGYILIHVISDHPDLNRLVHGIWETYEGAKVAFDHFKEINPNFQYAIASYPIYKDGEGVF